MGLREGYRWVLLVLLAIVMVDTRLYFLAAAAREEALAHIEHTLDNGSEMLLARLDQLLDTYDRTLSGVSEVVSARGGIAPGSDIYLHRLLVRRHALTPGLSWLYLLRENGLLAERSDSFPAPHRDLADRDYFRVTAGDWERGLYIGAPLRSRVDSQPFIPVARRVLNDGNRLLGVTVGGIAPAQLLRLLEEEALPEGYTLRLFLEGGQALACLPAADCQTRDWLRSPLFPRWLQEAARGRFEAQDLGDAAGPGAYARSSRYPVLVVATADAGRALAPWHEARGGYWAAALGANLALGGLAAYALVQGQRRRKVLAELAAANQGLEAGVAARTEELRQRETQARTFMNTAMDAVVVIDGESCIREFNRAAERMFGYAAAEVLGQRLELLMPPEMAADHTALLLAAAQQEAVRVMGRGREVLARARDGRCFPVEVSVGSSNEAGRNLYVGIIRDISERKQVEQELQRLATTDGLTGVLNRRAFTAEAEGLAALARRYDRPLAVLILDADKFKGINDNYGHPAGDEVLKALARVVESVLRQTDRFGRLGGEEFGIVLPETDAAGAVQLGERMLAAVRACRVCHEGRELAFTVSIGAAGLDLSQGDLESTFKNADAALYRAKQGGRDRLVLAAPEALDQSPAA